MLIVQKYGGTSVANADRIMHVANRIAKEYRAGKKVVVVLSAQGRLTDLLLQKAHEITQAASKRELDMLLTTGEQQSVALMAMALHTLDLPAISLNAAQIGLLSTGQHGNARIKHIQTTRINKELDKGNIVLVAGFQGVNSQGDLTTLGRGASDTTAVALAAVLKADLCEICTDVDGVYTADPKVVPTARKLKTISYDEMLEMSCQVLANRAAEMAKRYNVKLIIRSSMTEEPGTEIKEGSNVESLHVSGLAIDRDVTQISVIGINMPGAAYRIFSLLAKENILVDIILQTPTGTNTDISFTVAKQAAKAALTVLDTNRESLGFETVIHNDNLAKLSIVGAGMLTSPGVASTMFEALHENDIDIIMITTSEIKITVLIDDRHTEKAKRVVHDRFI
ncbi:MAG: aspartate kinase [Defluviitaleaceae bacterium]|nr:aspartate kinase [Defluviitaleaceae bacterium]